MRLLLLFTLGFIGMLGFSQNPSAQYITKNIVVKDSVKLESTSINPSYFIITTKQGDTLKSNSYTINYSCSVLTLKSPIKDTLTIRYLKYPNFLTKTYKQLDTTLITEKTGALERLHKLTSTNRKDAFSPFSGLNTTGSISRGVTIGNNQNSVLNSELDLQITGKLSNTVTLRASIQDANIPLQDNGYSQRLDEFDQVFIELLSTNWNIRAGDIDLNNNAYYTSFSKRVQGLLVNANLNNTNSTTNLFASGALVRGQFSRSQFIAQEGNQGPYKLQGANGELFVLIVSGSETVYVNGIPLTRGENNDYIIDYNAGEIIFNATFPITSEMRITVDYQYSDRNYSRLVAFGGGAYKTNTLEINASVYSENDSKNNPLQQNLSQEQIQLLSNAGDNMQLMTAPSASLEAFNENRILYKKAIVNGIEIFVFSNNPDDELYSVSFTQVGDNQGNYTINTTNAINNIYEYVAPVAGIPQGNFEPVIQLVAPTKLQLATLNGTYKPTKNTIININLSGSKNDLNLFSNIDDENNDGYAAKLKAEQQLFKTDSLWQVNVFIDTDFINKNFKTIERLYNPEFNRDWNLSSQESTISSINLGNQLLINSGIHIKQKNNTFNYAFEHLTYSEIFNGKKHHFNTIINSRKLKFGSNTSILKAENNANNSNFTRSYNTATYTLKKQWLGAHFLYEKNEEKHSPTDSLTPLSQGFKSYQIYTGVGDSTAVYAEIGYTYRENDSIVNNTLNNVNTANTWYLKSKLFNTNNTNLEVFANYRTLKHNHASQNNDNSLNSRLQYHQKIINQSIQWNTLFETNSGSLAQQDFTYVEVETGQGTYTWIDYNTNGIQELEEFEVAQFQDQGNYVRVLLPNQVYIKTHQNRLSQTLTINPQLWFNNRVDKPFISKLYNQTSYLIDKKTQRNNNNFNLNIFKNNDETILALQSNFRNSLFYNRGKQHFSTTYTYLTNKSKNLLSIGTIENSLKSHQFNFNHKFLSYWLFTFDGLLNKNKSNSENFSIKNFNLNEVDLSPKITYLFNDNTRLETHYTFNTKNNTINNLETLKQHTLGVEFSYTKSTKSSINTTFNYISNTFTGNQNTPVAYQMLEGLQSGTNFTWSILAQKKLTKFLDLNLNYFGRKSENSKTIHTGNIQLKAYF